MGFWKKLKFWRRRRDVRADFQKHSEEMEKKLKDIEATEATLEEELKRRNSESKKVVATLCDRIVELEGKLEQCP
jgi:predicted nuclease with TOPRIM domain